MVNIAQCCYHNAPLQVLMRVAALVQQLLHRRGLAAALVKSCGVAALWS